MYMIESGSIWQHLRSMSSVEMPQEEGPSEKVHSNVMQRIVP
jgi:hypothetical protein